MLYSSILLSLKRIDERFSIVSTYFFPHQSVDRAFPIALWVRPYRTCRLAHMPLTNKFIFIYIVNLGPETTGYSPTFSSS